MKAMKIILTLTMMTFIITVIDDLLIRTITEYWGWVTADQGKAKGHSNKPCLWCEATQPQYKVDVPILT